jgi:hypothetical protein
MNIRLSHQPPKVHFVLGYDTHITFFTVFDAELHSLLKTNSTEHTYDYCTDHCFPTKFGCGLAADFIEERTDLLKWRTDYYNTERAAERLSSIVDRFRLEFLKA